MGVLVTIGDSITLGAYLAAGDNYPARLGTTLCGWSVINRGIGGNTVIAPPPPGQQTMTDRFQADVLNQPGVTHCILWGGINDCGQVDATTLAGALRDLFWKGYAVLGANMHVCTLPPMLTTYPYYAGIEPDRESVNAWLRSYFGGPPGLLDFDSVLRTSQADNLDPIYSFDGLHPNPYGMMRLSDFARRYIA